MITKIANGKIIDSDKKYIYMEGGTIRCVTDEEQPFDILYDAGNKNVSPGFIDTHTHGAGGADFCDGDVASVLQALYVQRRFGATTVYPTITSANPKVTKNAIVAIGEAMRSVRGMNVPGIHMEGPYFSHGQSGAQDPKYITPPDKAQYEELIKIGEGSIKKWSFAPELPGASSFCEELIRHGIIPSIGHTDAVYDDVMEVYNAGCRLMTHFYSGMSTITRVKGYRQLGAIESGYLIDDIDVEVIADGCHLPAELLKLILKCKGREHICLITDSMRAAGTDSVESVLGNINDGMRCIVEGGVALLPDRNAFAGSVATCDRLVRTFVRDVGISISDAVYMLTAVPARIMGLKRKGKLLKGYDADIVIFDDDINITDVFVSGEKIGEDLA